jgi:hypothetical protein
MSIKLQRSIEIITIILLAGTLAGCGRRNAESPAALPPTATLDVQATVNAAVEATTKAEDGMQEAIDEGVSATLTALPPLVTPTAVPVEDMTQAEMSDAVDSSAAEAEAAAEQCSQEVENASADGEITYEEVVYLTYYAVYAEEEIQQAYDLAEEYLNLYADLAEETIEVLETIEDDLNDLAVNTDEISQTLDEIEEMLKQGQEVAQTTLDELNTQAETIQAKSDDVKAKSENWSTNVKTEIESLDELLANIQPNQSADSLRSALQMAKDYADTIKLSMSDGKFSKSELESIAQKGANATAGLQQFGGADLQNLAGSIGGMTGQFARGEMPQARASFSSFEMSLPSIPKR